MNSIIQLTLVLISTLLINSAPIQKNKVAESRSLESILSLLPIDLYKYKLKDILNLRSYKLIVVNIM